MVKLTIRKKEKMSKNKPYNFVLPPVNKYFYIETKPTNNQEIEYGINTEISDKELKHLGAVAWKYKDIFTHQQLLFDLTFSCFPRLPNWVFSQDKQGIFWKSFTFLDMVNTGFMNANCNQNKYWNCVNLGRKLFCYGMNQNQFIIVFIELKPDKNNHNFIAVDNYFVYHEPLEQLEKMVFELKKKHKNNRELRQSLDNIFAWFIENKSVKNNF